MKKNTLIAYILLTSTATSIRAQNVGINTTGATPNTSAILDISTGVTGKGFLAPQATFTSTTDATTIATPATGLMAYNPGSGGLSPAGYYYNSGTSGSPNWVQLLNGGSPGTAWLISGNPGTTVGTDFIGTTDAHALEFKVDGQKSGWIDYTSPNNTFFGYEAGNISTGTNNTAVGVSALQGNTSATDNTAIGEEALYTNSTGAYNTAVGVSALQGNTTANDNTGIGEDALYTNSTGAYNTAVGVSALQNNSTASDNTAVGYSALQLNGTGSPNTAVGYEALEDNVSGTNNVAVGDNALGSNTSNDNTAVGSGALSTNTTGTENTALGDGANVNGNNYTNATAIGYGASATATNNFVLGNSSVSALYCKVTSITTISDKRFKRDITEDIHGLDFIMKLRPVSYYYNVKKLQEYRHEKSVNEEALAKAEQVKFSGFIAQEVESAAEESNFDFTGVDKPQDDSGTYGLKYTEFVMPLVKAVQEQQKMIDSLKVANENLKMTNEKMQSVQEKNETDKIRDEADIAELKRILKSMNQSQVSIKQ